MEISNENLTFYHRRLSLINQEKQKSYDEEELMILQHILTCSLVNTDPIFSHDSLQTSIPGSAVSIGSPRGDLCARGPFLSLDSEWHVLNWTEFRSPLRPTRPSFTSSWRQAWGISTCISQKALLKISWVFFFIPLLPTLFRIHCMHDYFLQFVHAFRKQD